MSAFQRAREGVLELSAAVEHLAASLLPGTARPWRASPVSAEKRAELDHKARLEARMVDVVLPAHLRSSRSVVAPGEAPAPYSLDIADLLTEVLIAADALAETVAQHAGVERLATASSAYADPRPYLAHVHQHLLAAQDADPLLLGTVERECARLLQRAHEALGLVTDGQLLAAVCPWCDGRTSAHPVGGQRTLRVRLLPAPKGETGRPIIVCEGGLCEPTSADCGIWWRGLPAWDLENEGAWLADRLSRRAA